MPDLNFTIEAAEPELYAAGPHLIFKLRTESNQRTDSIPAVALRCQIRIEPSRRSYTGDEREGLLDLFGRPERWGQTLRPMLWTHTSLVIPKFTGTTVVDMHVPCTFDFNVASTKYFYAIEDGEIPLCLLFSGTIFYVDEVGYLQISPISWEKETRFRLPVQTWKDMMSHYYPNIAWLAVDQHVFDRFHRYKSQHGLPTWEQALSTLLDTSEEKVKT